MEVPWLQDERRIELKNGVDLSGDPCILLTQLVNQYGHVFNELEDCQYCDHPDQGLSLVCIHIKMAQEKVHDIF